MKQTTELVLIEGTFNSQEALKLVSSLLNYKINYHDLEIFSRKELDVNADISRSERRIAELKISGELLKEIIAEANKHNQNLSIHSIIKIELIDNEPTKPSL
ncbi:MAG: hypothetical protein J0I09_04000 [Sphingobacteriia bacterium]|nr:hypothetical protein [Sphingobacteriia bacterium]